MQTDDITAWLTAIWDEDERAEGRKFRSRKDVPQPDSIMHGWPEDDLVTIRRPLDDSDTVMSHVAYIAESCEPNPDLFTLARIAADRKILALHEPYEMPSWPATLCRNCAGGAGEGPDWPCDTVRLLAEPHATRPGYDEAWRP